VIISSIEVEDRVVKLNQVSEGVPNIFDIDSVSLLIGNNGTGKTHLLSKVLDRFAPRAKDDRFSCDIYLDSGKRMSYEEMRKGWGVVYYSPIPYGRRAHPAKNLIDASPNWSKSISVFDLRSHEDILSEFNISPQVYARKAVDVRKICRLIVDLMVVQNFPAVESGDLERPAASLIDFLGRYSKNERENISDERLAANFDREERKHIDEAAGNVYQLLTGVINSDVRAFCFFAVLDYVIGHSRKSSEVVRFLVSDVLSHGFSYSSRERSQAVSKAYDDIQSAVEFIKSHRADLKMGSRASVEIALDPYKKNPLHDWNVQHLFDVGFQNMSSGQLAILAQLSLISDAIKSFSERGIKRVLLLIDEGDAFLHLEWQRKYIGHLNGMLSKLKHEYGMFSIQLILATHSPLLATDVPKEFICRMETRGDNAAPSAFAAPLHELLNQSFGAKTVGEFASRKINEVVSDLSEGRRSHEGDFIVSSIDNPIIKAEVLRRAKDEGYQG